MIVQDLEASVIGGLLIGGLTPDADDVISTMAPDAFSIPAYRKIFTEIQRQAKTRNLIDPMLVAESVGDELFATVMETYRACPSAANLRGYAGQVSANHERRQILGVISETHSRIAEGAIYVAETAIDEMLSRIQAIRTPRDEIRPVRTSELLDAYVELLDERSSRPQDDYNLKTGIEELDELMGGINPDSLIVLAGRPGMGKTELALSISQGVARQRTSAEHRRGVLIFSMEMSGQQIIERQIADVGNLSVSTLRNPSTMGDEDWARVSMGVGELQGIDCWVVDISRLTVEQVRAIATRHKQRHPGLSLIVIDYLTLMELPKTERHDLAVAHVTGTLKRTAMALGTPVLLLSQLSRKVEDRANKRPTNSDLRDSGSIEQDADFILMTYRDAVYNEQSAAAPYAEIIVTKNRHGKLGTVYRRFVKGHFKPCDQNEAREACAITPQAQKSPRRYASGADV